MGSSRISVSALLSTQMVSVPPFGGGWRCRDGGHRSMWPSRRSSSSREDRNFCSVQGTMWCLPLPAWVISALPLPGYWGSWVRPASCLWGARPPALALLSACDPWAEEHWAFLWLFPKMPLPDILAYMLFCLNLYLCALYISWEFIRVSPKLSVLLIT